MLNKIITYILSILLLISISAAIYAWYKPPVKITTTQYIEVPKVKTVTKIKEIKVPGPTQIVTIEKEVVVEKLKLPDWFKTDENKQVIATAEIAPYSGKTDTIAILDTKTGESQIIAKQVPLPMFSFENDKEIGIRAGMGLNATEVSLYAKWSFLRVGNFHVGAYGEANTRGDAKAQIEIGYRF
jgi:hypothetical protein